MTIDTRADSAGPAGTEGPRRADPAAGDQAGDQAGDRAAAGPARPRLAGWALPARDAVAIGLAGAGTLLLFISLLVDWQRVSLPDADSQVRLDAGIGDIPTWGTAFVLGSMLLVALFVSVIALPLALGRAARVLGIAWAVTLGGVVAATVVRLAEGPADLNVGLLGGLFGDVEGLAVADTAWGPGVYVAVAALLTMIAAFAAACPPLHDPDGAQR